MGSIPLAETALPPLSYRSTPSTGGCREGGKRGGDVLGTAVRATPSDKYQGNKPGCSTEQSISELLDEGICPLHHSQQLSLQERASI